MYSLIVGEVINIHLRRACLSDSGEPGVDVDIEKVRPVSRLGYGQEYTIIEG